MAWSLFRRREQAVSDPVCGMAIKPSESAFSLPAKDRVVYFCSAECMSRYRFEPQRYST